MAAGVVEIYLYEGGLMKNFLIVMLALCVVVSCSKKEEDATGEETAAETEVGSATVSRSDEPVERIPGDEYTEMETLANAYLKPYFDAEATQTTKSVSPGDVFDLYVVGEFSKNYPMSAAEFRIVLPEGVNVVSSAYSDSTILQFGNPLGDFMMAFRCSYGPKLWLVRYECGVDENFKGGSIETGEGLAQHYLGFTLCDVSKTLIRAKPGKAELRHE